MLTVLTPEEVEDIIYRRFPPLADPAERVGLGDAPGRTLYGDIIANEFVPGFDRSTVDGYAVVSSDTFGCSESIPAMLSLSGEVLMGHASQGTIQPGSCVSVSTGGDLPDGADAVVMLEYAEDYGSGFIGITSPVAPGNNIIFKGDDVSPGDRILPGGTILAPSDIGILAALGYDSVSVRRRPIVGIISTGDELVLPSESPGRGQIRDVNTPLLAAAIEKFGALPLSYGIIRDVETDLKDATLRAVTECDIVLVSGGSSAGARDLTARVIESSGVLLFHGIAMKPGKPTILGVIDNKPVFGLPGHPVAAYFVTELFVRLLISRLMGAAVKRRSVQARISEAVSSNHGRAEYIAIALSMAIASGELGDVGAERLELGVETLELGSEVPVAFPIKGKSGLITSLAGADGYICIPRDSEGIPKGEIVTVTLF